MALPRQVRDEGTLMGSIVTSRGQVTIPKRLRDHLGIRPGSEVVFELTADGRVVLSRPAGPPAPSRFERVRGTASTGLTTDQIMALMRGDE